MLLMLTAIKHFNDDSIFQCILEIQVFCYESEETLSKANLKVLLT